MYYTKTFFLSLFPLCSKKNVDIRHTKFFFSFGQKSQVAQALAGPGE